MLKPFLIFLMASLCAHAQQNFQQEFSNLLEADRAKYLHTIQQVDELNTQHKVFSAFLKLDEARQIFSNDPSRIYREATFYVSINYEAEARRCYKSVLKLVPNDYHTLESLTELSFRNQKWKLCIQDIERFRAAHPRQTSLYPLLAFKQLICLQKLGDHKQFHFYMQRFLKQFSYMEDTPMYYYLRALEAVLANDEALAIHYIASSWKVFQHPGLHQSWTYALIHADYLPEYKLMTKTVKRYTYIPFTL